LVLLNSLLLALRVNAIKGPPVIGCIICKNCKVKLWIGNFYPYRLLFISSPT
jgi:hypothetical protein